MIKMIPSLLMGNWSQRHGKEVLRKHMTTLNKVNNSGLDKLHLQHLKKISEYYHGITISSVWEYTENIKNDGRLFG